MSKKTRLDILLTERGLQESRQKAQAAIMAGIVFVNGRKEGIIMANEKFCFRPLTGILFFK